MGRHLTTSGSLLQFAVMLMNCNSANEGHKVYKCTPEMTLKECTSEFDGNARSHYLMFANRARATCFQSQQSAVRLRMEATVNEVSARNEENLQAVASIKNGGPPSIICFFTVDLGSPNACCGTLRHRCCKREDGPVLVQHG